MRVVFRIMVFVLLVPGILSGCKRNYVPKPSGYLRIDFPAKEYRLFDTAYPYSFEYPVYADIMPDTDEYTEPYWIDVRFPEFDGTIHISYKKVTGNLDTYTEDSRTMAYKHSIKADAINETVYADTVNRVYGLLYEIKGNAASSLQFYATDSTSNFIRGSLYFNVSPNKDSLAPVIDFFRVDIIHLIETVRWNRGG
jgi:gliding motility-associated lipoprotein GldD